jgi:CBS domain-containing protein
MRVQDVMTKDVATARPETSLKEVAAILVEKRISGVPVCDADGGLVGVVSEADILVKEEGVEPERRRALAWLLRGDNGVSKFAATTAGEAMTSPAVTIDPSRPVSDAARLMIERSVNRLPVVDDGKLVGIVTRADLVAAFTRGDEEIRREIVDELLVRTLWIEPGLLRVDVDRGRVTISGQVDTPTEMELASAFIRRVPGVVDVDARGLHAAIEHEQKSVGRLPRRV